MGISLINFVTFGAFWTMYESGRVPKCLISMRLSR